jgi:hypothetical protein
MQAEYIFKRYASELMVNAVFLFVYQNIILVLLYPGQRRGIRTLCDQVSNYPSAVFVRQMIPHRCRRPLIDTGVAGLGDLGFLTRAHERLSISVLDNASR